MKQNCNFQGLNLEGRYQYGENEWPFHDYFLIFPGTPASVWSLGASLNHIGAEHCILHKVEHPHAVLKAFNELWDELEKNIIWNNDDNPISLTKLEDMEEIKILLELFGKNR